MDLAERAVGQRLALVRPTAVVAGVWASGSVFDSAASAIAVGAAAAEGCEEAVEDVAVESADVQGAEERADVDSDTAPYRSLVVGSTSSRSR